MTEHSADGKEAEMRRILGTIHESGKKMIKSGRQAPMASYFMMPSGDLLVMPMNFPPPFNNKQAAFLLARAFVQKYKPFGQIIQSEAWMVRKTREDLGIPEEASNEEVTKQLEEEHDDLSPAQHPDRIEILVSSLNMPNKTMTMMTEITRIPAKGVVFLKGDEFSETDESNTLHGPMTSDMFRPIEDPALFAKLSVILEQNFKTVLPEERKKPTE